MKNGIIITFLLLVILGNNNAYSQDIDNSELIRSTVLQTKAALPMKIDAMTTFVDIVGGNNSLTYLYDVDMDLSQLQPQQLAFIKQKFPEMICRQMTPLICGVGKAFLEKGITINTKYKVKDGTSLAECHYSQADCVKLPSK